MNEKPIDKIKRLTGIQTRIFEIINELTEFDVNLAQQHLRNAAADIATGMGKIAILYETKSDNKPTDQKPSSN